MEFMVWYSDVVGCLTKHQGIQQTQIFDLGECHLWYKCKWLFLLVGFYAPNKVDISAILQCLYQLTNALSDFPTEKSFLHALPL